MRNVIFLAPPLAGKGTFSDYLVENYSYQHFSTGSILRNCSVQNDSLKDILESGELVRDEIILPLVEEALKNRDKSKPFILDGFPRTLHQAQNLDIILSDLGIFDVVVIVIDVNKKTLIDRVMGRRVCSNCYRSYNLNQEAFRPLVSEVCDDCGYPLITRDDDKLDSFLVRYETYLKSTEPIIEYYREKNCLQVICNDVLDQTEAFLKLRGVIREY